MTPRDVLLSVAAGTLVVLALADLYADALLAASASAVAWWLLRDPAPAPVPPSTDEVSPRPAARG